MAESETQGSGDLRRAGLVLACLLGITALAFAPGLIAGYAYDDVLLISENPYAQDLRYLWRGFTTHLWDVYSFGSAGIGLTYYRPLVSASYVLNWALGGGSALGFHAVNLLAHLAATALALRALRRWTGRLDLALLGALVFALHPSRTESVHWIAGRTDTFQAVATLGAAELALAAAAQAGAARTLRVVLAALATAVAILCKEGGALGFLLLLPDCLAAEAGTERRRLLLRVTLGLAALGLGYLAVRSVVYPVNDARAAFEPTPRYGLFTVWAYVERVLLPWPQTFFYRPVEARGGTPHHPLGPVLLGATAAALYVALLVRQARRDPASFALLAGAVVLLGPLLNFWFTRVYVTTSDHFLYLPLLLLVGGLLRASRDGAARRLARPGVRAIAAGVLALYAGVVAVRALDYRDDEALFTAEVEVLPENPVALAALSRISARRGDLDEALALARRAAAPEATRYFLLAGDAEQQVTIEGRILALEAALTADGDAARLAALDERLEGLLHGRLERRTGQRLDDRGFLDALTRYPAFATLAADAALVQTRVGREARARELARAIPDEMSFRLSSAPNFVLTLARVGEFARARRLLDRLASPPPGVPAVLSPEAAADLRGRVDRAEAGLRGARGRQEAELRLGVALVHADLGQYLRALRVLGPLVAAGGAGGPSGPGPFVGPAAPPEGVLPLYVQLLVSARLDAEALRVATSALGEERARTVVEQYRAALPPSLAALPAAPDDGAFRGVAPR